MARSTGKHRAPETRSLHLIDLENLVGGVVTAERVRAVWQRYVEVVGVDRDDAVVVSVAKRNSAVAAFNLPPNILRVIGQDVHDGADVALAEAVDVRHSATRFSRVYLASCDHYFSGLAREFRALGRPVTQVIGSALVSAELYRACPSNLYLAG